MAGDSLMMEALVHELISLLNDNSPFCYNKCQSIVSRIKQYILSNLIQSEFDYALSVLFQCENSLLDFISRGCCAKTLKGGIRDSLSLIIELIQKNTKDIAQYFKPIKDVCFEIVMRSCGAEVLKYSYDVIKEIINSDGSVNVKTDLQIPEIIDFMHSRCLSNKSIKPLALQGVYELYGAIALKYPEYCPQVKCNSLVRNIIQELKCQMRNTNNVKPCVIEGCMNALKGVLTNTNRAYDDEDPTESKQIYSYVRDACAFQEEATRRVFQRAALDVFTTHIAQLWGWVVKNEDEDVTFWLGNLSKWAARSSSEDRRAGIRALEALHRQAMEHLRTHPEDPMKKDFMMYYRKALDNSTAADYDMDLAIEGISGLMGLSGSEVNQEDISFIFRVILQKAEIDFPLEGKAELGDERLAKYLECLSNICSKLHSATNDQLSAITRLWRRVVERYPHLYPPAQFNIEQSLKATVLKMAMCDATVFDKFLYPVVYQSVIVTCSHTLVEEAELQEELTGKQVVTYQHYLPLWRSLFRIGYESKPKDKVPGETPELRRGIVDKLYDCFIKSLIAIVEKLNVGYKRDDTTEDVKTDPENSLKGEVPQDHSVLCNLANLYREILAKLVPEKLYKWLAELITTVVNQSVKFPLVSAFYKLLAAILSVAQRADYFCDETEETQSLGQYVVRYLEDVMLQCHQYKNDLQASCLLAVVSVPVPLIENLLAGIAPVLQMIFQLGQSLLSLACCGMDALELWQGKLPLDKLQPILHLALPLFDPYLRSRGITTELPEDAGMKMSKRQQKRARRSQEASRLSTLQRRMLRLLSQLDSSTCLGLLRRPVDTTAWSAEATITFNLPFPDQRFNVELDPLLPRVVELALTSSDRQTKTAACEVLHAFVIVFIGDGPKKRSTLEPELVKVLSRLMPPLLRLSCGSDLVARQLFHPLTFQLMHWFCHPGMLEVRAPVQTEAVLQAVWDGITDEEDPALQDFSALCLQEFVAWSIKQSSVEHLADSVGPLAAFRQIKSYCLHPSLAKRRGAAMAFSHVAKVLREEASLVDQYWLEAMYHLVLNLELGDCLHHPAAAALAHGEKVLRRHADLFNKASDVRRVPAALGSGVLRDVLKFLLQKCGSKTAICAAKCRELLVAMMKWVPDAPRPDQLEDMVRVCEGAGNDSILPFQPSVADSDHIHASIDCYAWAIKMGFIDPDVALKPPSRLVPSVQYFINLLDPTVVPTVFCSRGDFALTRAKCDVVVALFDLLAVTDEKIKHLPDTFFRAKFWKLLAVCVFSPHNIGLDWRNRELSDSLNDKLRLLLCTLRDHLDEGSLQELYDALSSQVLYDCTSCVDRLSHLCQGLRHLELKDKQFVDGLITLHKTDFLHHLKHGSTWNGNALVNGVFSSMFDSEELPLHPETSVKVFADQLLRFAVVLEAEVRTTLRCVINSEKVNNLRASTSVIITKGQHFLALFEDRLIAHLLQDPNLSVTQLLSKPSVANVEIILQMLSASKYAKAKFNRSAEALLTSLTAAWWSLEAWAGASQASSWLVTLMQAMVQMLPPAKVVGGLSAAPAISAWLYRQITDASLRLESKTELVELLPSVVSERTDAQLEEVMRYLQHQFPVTTKELREGSSERNTFVTVYKALLRTLVATGSVTVLRAVCESAADTDHACAEAIEAALVDLMKKHKDEVQIQALKMVHDKFLDESKDVEFRLCLMSRFLITLLCYASKAAVTQFYADRVQNIIDVLEERLRQHDAEWKSKQQLVRKIGACRLVEPLFSRLDKTELENKEHPVTKAASTPGSEKLSKYLATAILNVRKLSCSREELQELFRRFQCAAYNALILFVCNTNQSIKHFSVLAFKEEPMRPIWRRIVPTEPKYIFPIHYDDYPKMKKQLVQMRSLVREGAANQPPAIYLPSQSLFNSSLQEDITCFDFSMYNVRDADRMQQVSNEENGAPSAARLELEEGCLNDHECMSTLTLVVRHLCEKFPITGAEVKRPQPPEWMENLRVSLVAPDQPDNCRAFIVKLIVNCENYFKPYAHFWISPIMQCVLDNCVGDTFNSLVHDIVCMLLNWHSVDIPEFTTEDKLKASEFLRLLVLRASCEQIEVMKYNIDLIKSVVTMWKSVVSVPYQELLDVIRPPPTGPSPLALGASVADVGVLLADVFLANEILPFNQTGKSIYYEHLLVHLQRPESKIYKTTANVIGKVLKIVSNKNQLRGEDLEFFNRVVDVVKPKDLRNTVKRERNNEQFINCLHQIQTNYPSIVKGFEAQCISFISQYPANYSEMLLEILTTALMDFDFQKEAFSMLTDLPRFLEDESNPDRQVATLKLVDKLAPNLTPSQMSKLLPPVVALRNHKRAETRTVIYDILCWIYDHYRELRDDYAESHAKVAKSELISGFADPDVKLQEKLYRYWATDRISSEGWGRLVDILRTLYSPSCEPAFLASATTLLLELCQKTDEYKRNIHNHPLSACKFEKYAVSGSFRTQHAAFVPMFADTLASQISSLSMGSFDFNFQLRATQSPSSLYSATLQSSISITSTLDQSLPSFPGPSTSAASFGHKYKQGPSFGSDYLVANDTTEGEPGTSHSPLRKKRVVRDKKKVSRSFADHNRAKAAQQKRHEAERQRRREGEVTLTRDYRKGDLPDIQIPYSDVITALTTLAKRDQLIARQLLVAVYKALVVTGVNPDVAGVSSALDHILQSSTSHEPPLMATVLEMSLVKPEACRSPASVITQVCKNSHQMSVGALLVEARLMAEEEGRPPPSKRGRGNTVTYDDWMYLAEIYHSLEEKDVVQGLFEDKIAEACSAAVREALQAEDQARWMQARTKYTQCLDSQSGTAAENFLFEASIKCSAHLSKWKELNTSLKEDRLKNNMEEVWSDNWNRDHLLPWLFLSEVHGSHDTTVLSVAQDFNSALNEWLGDPTRKNHIESKLSEMLSVLLVVRDETARAKLASEASVRQFLTVWQQLDSLNNHLRGSRLLSVHRLVDIDRFIELPPASDVEWTKKVDQLMAQWKGTSPSKTDNLVSWETQAVYRNIFIRKLEAKKETHGNRRQNLGPSKLDNYLKTLECALKQKNFYVARNYLQRTENEINGSGARGKLHNDLALNCSKVRLLRAELEKDNMDKFLEVWDPLVNLRTQEASGSLDYPLNRDLHFHMAEVYRTLLSMVQDRPSILDKLSASGTEKLAHLELGDAPTSLKRQVVTSLERAVAVTESRTTSEVLADAYLRLTVFCHQIDDPLYRDKLIQSLLRAMKYGSHEARILFPCLLEPSLAEHADLFISESKQVPEWMFLSWVAQLLAHLDTEVGHVVAPLLVDLAKTYPTALQFPFQLSKEMYQYSYPTTRTTVAELSDLLRMDAPTKALLRGLSCVCQPHLCLLYHLERLRSVVSQNLGDEAISDAYESMTSEAFPPDDNDKFKGKVFNAVKKFTDEVENAYNKFGKKEISTADFVKKLEMLYSKVKDDLERAEKRIELALYSPWLANEYNGDVEIPGQYTGESRPLPNHHVTIKGFKREVMPLKSLRWPTKITILGNDARDHPFLVKFGEDLRQDQRIQQLFVLMNQLLAADVTAGRRQLSVQAYSVVPLNSRLGIIQWVEKTTTLKNFMISPDLVKKAEHAEKIYHIQHFSRCNTRDPTSITRFYKTIKKEDSTRMYRMAVNELPAYMLRDAVLKMSTSPEAFFHLRSVMLTNHACLSVCHWLLGIGDRHLDNTLVCVDSGRLLGIDFGHAFGTATQLISVPELMPFRLTPQILNLAVPLGTTGLIKETMVHTLRVLRGNSRLLLATMAVFILEPSVDWLKAARRHEAYMEAQGTGSADWLPQLKISLARRKLEGAHPRKVMEEDLKMGHGSKPHYKKLAELVWDEGDSPHLREMPHDGLSPRQQVECLIAHATNSHILSKTYSGWASWV